MIYVLVRIGIGSERLARAPAGCSSCSSRSVRSGRPRRSGTGAACGAEARKSAPPRPQVQREHRMDPTRAKPAGTVTLLRYWLLGSAVALTSFLIWIIAPVLFLVLALTAGLGVICAVIVMLARRLERWKHEGAPPSEEA